MNPNDSSSDDDEEVPDEMEESNDTGRISAQNSQISMKPQSPGRQINVVGTFGGDWRKMPLNRQVSILSIHEHQLELST